LRKTRVRRRHTSLKRIVLSLLVIIVVFVAGATAVALWGMMAAQAPGPLSEPTNVVIERGQPTVEIGAALERSGVISDQRLFVLTSYLTRSMGGVLKAGEYEFPAGASLVEVLAILRSGRVVVHRITVPEGWTSAQVVERVNAHPVLTGAILDHPPEGSLLPDTYVFQRGASRDSIIARMRQAQEALLDELWDKRVPDLPFRTKEEAVILASIVEKETAVAEERQQVAAVFVNRLRRNMRLQSDPTIIYGITGGERPLDRPIRRSDISETTPYNTYRIDGLPPTPIANPGREAIAAVLQPDTTDHLYFVADGSGGHAFARTLNEHNENVRRWRQIEQAAASEPAQEDEAERPSAPDEPAAASAVEPAVPAQAPTPNPEEPAAGQDQPEELVAAVAAREESVASEEPADTLAGLPADDPRAPAEVTPQPKPDPAEILAERAVPIPMPKPQRN
jgi:UPF0755 protein